MASNISLIPILVVATLIRIPKTAFYLWLIMQGWGLGAG